MDTLRTAETLRDAGMARALQHAERAIPSWGELAYAYLVRFARHHATFISEDVSDAAERDMPFGPPDLRAWGQVYRLAQRRGVIRMCGLGKSRRRHASVCPLWQSQIFTGGE